MSTAEQLAACPFCGEQPRISSTKDESLWSHDEVIKTAVRCDDCDISTAYTESGQEPGAVEIWNHRAAYRQSTTPAQATVTCYVSAAGTPPDAVGLRLNEKAEWVATPAQAQAAALYEAIKHGDDAHKAWLREAVAAWFNGQPVPPPVMSAQAPAQAAEPVDMVLFCPACGKQHIDAPEEHWNREFLHSWENPPHRSHLCRGCGHIWRPADVPTNGVSAVKTKGKADSPLAAPHPSEPAATGRALSDYNELLSIVGDIVGEGHMSQEGLARLRAHLEGSGPLGAWLGSTGSAAPTGGEHG